MKIALLLVWAGVSFAAPRADSAATSNAAPSASLASGVVLGTTSTVSTPTVATAAVTQYLGIPFAASPPRRFGPPQAPLKWNKPLLAQQRKPVCLQEFSGASNGSSRVSYIFNDPGSPPPVESEDCMYLNVFTPPGSRPGDKKAVLFWIFGGNLQFGGGSLHLYDGSSMAYFQDVIVVTHNYRTNIFGFPGSPQIPTDGQNLGFMDQRFALKWVQDNIEAFGGDPSKVTIFGQSAGGFSVRSLIGLPPKPLPFRAAIMESESAFNTEFNLLTNNNMDFGSSWLQTAAGLGCSNPQTQLDCMRKLDAQKIKDYVVANGLGFFPVPDSKTYVADIRPAIKDGSAAKVPFIIGTNRDEATFVTYAAGLDPDTTNLTEVFTRAFPKNPKLVKTLVKLGSGQVATDFVVKVLTDAAFLCPASQLARYAHNNGYSVYRYFYIADFPNLHTYPNPGAYHASEITQVYGTYFLNGPLGPATPAQISLSKKMQAAWAKLAKTPSQGPQGGWPELGDTGRVWEWGANGGGDAKEISAASIQSLDCNLLQFVPGQQPL